MDGTRRCVYVVGQDRGEGSGRACVWDTWTDAVAISSKEFRREGENMDTYI